MSAHLLVDGREFVAGRRTGIGRFLEGLLLAVRAAHPDWRVTLGMDDPAALPAALAGGVEPRRLPPFPELVWRAWAGEADLFLSPYPKLPWRPLPCPAVHTVHDVLYLTEPAYRASRVRHRLALARLRRALQRASLTWFDSRVSERACREFVAVPARAAVRHPAVEAAFAKEEGAWQRDDPFFLYVGNGLPHKNVGLLLDAVAESRLELVCVGVDETRAAALLARHPAGAGRVRFLRDVGDDALRDLYRRATALLLPSSIEGYGYPPLEAMACGTPAIVSDIPVLRETLRGGPIYRDPFDPAAWRSAMEGLLDPGERARRAAIGAAAVRPLLAPAGWRKHIEDLEIVMERGGA